MLDPHISLGIAQTVFYVPMLPLAIWLMIRNGKLRPRMAWWPLIPFSTMRLAGGPVLIALESNKGTDGSYSIGLLIAAIILLNVGVIPLVIADMGLTRLILQDNFGDGPFTRRINLALRLTAVGAVALLSSGGALSSQTDGDQRSTGHTLTLVGYIIFVVELAVLTAMQTYYYTRRTTLLPSGHQVLKGALLASPFILVRTIYGIIEASHSADYSTIWNPVFGSPDSASIVLFVFMALVMEYIALIIYLWSGFSIKPDRGLPVAGHPQAGVKV